MLREDVIYQAHLNWEPKVPTEDVLRKQFEEQAILDNRTKEVDEPILNSKVDSVKDAKKLKLIRKEDE